MIHVLPVHDKEDPEVAYSRELYLLGKVVPNVAQVRGRGELLAYCSQEPRKCAVNGKLTEYTYTQSGGLKITIPYNASEVAITV